MLADHKLSNCEQGVFRNRFALLNYRQKNFDLAAALFMQAHRNYSSCEFNFPNFMILQGTLSNAGMSYTKINKFDSAAVCYTKGLNFLNTYVWHTKNEKRDILDAKGVFYFNIGELNMLKGEKLKATHFFEKSVE
ncbi:MAG: hypothetical protein EOP46_21560, partial [Sphingobacteriaceae bacterium]